MNHVDTLLVQRIANALERLAEAEEDRNRAIAEEAAWRRESFERDQAMSAARWAQFHAELAPEAQPGARHDG